MLPPFLPPQPEEPATKATLATTKTQATNLAGFMADNSRTKAEARSAHESRVLIG
jgi:hypothetical protein